MKKIFLWLIAINFTAPLIAQQHLDRYVAIGLQNNETIKQQQFLFSKSMYALQEAKGLLLPTTVFNTSYTLAGGGRTVDIPVGDIVNPVYKTLNQLTATNNFPQVQNQSVLLNPNNFYDVKLRTTYPVINAEILYNRKIKRQQSDLQKIEIDIYKRELVKEIKTAYFRYLQSEEAIRVYESSLRLVTENLRINTALFNNQKANRTAVIRTENEVTKYKSLIESANQTRNNAKATFNVLLNRGMDNEIQTDSINRIPDQTIITDRSVMQREELAKLQTAGAINDNVAGLARSYRVPSVNSFLDAGSQGFDFKVNNKTLYYFFGLSLEWKIFSGNRNKYKIKQAETDAAVIQSQTAYVQQQLQLQVNISVNLFTAAVAQYRSACSQVTASQKYYGDILRLYKEGQALFIELLDAQNQWITALLQGNISLYDTWIKAAEIERANAGFQL